MPSTPVKKITSIHCSDCGKTEKLRWMEDIKQLLIQRNLCFTCNFWGDYVKKSLHPNSVRISSNHYWIGDESLSHKPSRGNNGRKFKIVFKNGKEIITTNLWDQGEIPPRFRSRLLDNAEFGKLIN